jgi:hypothetical protein
MWPWPIYQVYFAVVKAIYSNKTQKTVEHIGKTALSMRKPQKTTQGKDVVSIEIGKGYEKNGMEAKAITKVSANSEKGMTMSAEATVRVDAAYNAELSATVYNDNFGKTKVEGGNNANLLPDKPKDEISLDAGPVSVNINPKETKNIISDAIDGLKKYVEAELAPVKKMIKKNK